MDFHTLHHGYRRAVSAVTEDEYVVRTRPKNDGWMAINDTESIVLATGLSRSEAEETCRSYDRQVEEAIAR